MINELTTNMVSIFLTTKCTLNCKYCGAMIPKFRLRNMSFTFDIEITKKAIDRLFQIYSHIDHIDLTGGEPLILSKSDELCELIKHISKYKAQFNFIRMLTNGTLLPSDNLIGLIKTLDCPFDFYVDNYYRLSCNAEKLKEICNAEGIAYKEIVYGVKDQYCDGWVDFGDLSYKNYSDDQVQNVYKNCLQAHHKCLSIVGRKIYPCSVAPLGALLNMFPESDCGGIDLVSEDITIDEQKTVVSKFGTNMINACHYCNGFDSKNAPRFPAAEQA